MNEWMGARENENLCHKGNFFTGSLQEILFYILSLPSPLDINK
jgi:hypothetical protein